VSAGAVKVERNKSAEADGTRFVPDAKDMALGTPPVQIDKEIQSRGMGLNMNLAAILAICVLTLGWSPPEVRGIANHAMPPRTEQTDSNPPSTQGNASSSQSQAPANSVKPAASGTKKPTDSANQAQPIKRHPTHKNTVYPDCTISPAPLNPMPGSSTARKNAGSGSTGAASANTSSSTTNAAKGSSNTASAKARSPLKPCPPPKKVVRDGGSDEPTIQLLGGTPGEQARSQRSTDELTAATEENLKKITDRELSPTQRDMVNQIKQFMTESKTAVAAGDAERGHNLAEKARLLSDELVKP
jgi:hypothetical protein